MDEEQYQEELVNFPVSLDPPEPEYSNPEIDADLAKGPLDANTAPAHDTVAGKKYYDKQFLQNLKKNLYMSAGDDLTDQEIDEKAKDQLAQYADFKNLDNTLSEETKAILHKIAQQVHEKMLQKTGVSLAALIEQETKAALPPRPTRLFEDDKPARFWCWAVIRTDRVTMYRTKLRALKSLALELETSTHPMRSTWRVEPFYMGTTWADRVISRWRFRTKVRRLQKAAEAEALQNEIDAKEGRKVATQLPSPFAPIHVATPNVKWVPSHHGSPADLEPVSVPSPEGTQGFAVNMTTVAKEVDGKVQYEVQKLNEGVSEVLGYDVQPYVVMHPKTYDDLIADDKVLG